MAVDRTGNIYLAVLSPICGRECERREFLQKRSPGGRLLAEWGSPGVSDLAVDEHGAIFETHATRIVKLSPKGRQVASWGRRGCGPGKFAAAEGLATDHTGNLYVTNEANGNVQKLSPTGRSLALWGGCRPFREVTGGTVDRHDHLYLVDRPSRQIHEYSTSGEALAQWHIDSAHATDIAVDAEGAMYVTTTGVDKLSPTGEPLARWRVSSGHPEGPGSPIQFNLLGPPLWGIAVDTRGDVYVAEPGHIQKLSPDGQVLATYDWDAQSGFAVDEQGNILVLGGSGGYLLHKLAPDGKQLGQWGPIATGPEWSGGRTLALDAQGNIYTATYGDHVYELSPTGSLVARWGKPGAEPGEFHDPRVMGVDSKGNVYVADVGNARVQKLTASG